MTDFNMPPGVSARDIPGQDDDETGSPYPITDQWAGLAKLMAPNAVVVGAALARSLESDLAAANDEITRLRAEVEALRGAVLAEREACAKVCEAISDQHSWDRRSADLAQACRDAIRARGNHDNRNTETT